MGRWWRGAGRVAGGVALLIAGCAASMALGYLVVRHLASDLAMPPMPEERRLDEALALRHHANALVLLLSDFTTAARGDTARFAEWQRQVFRPGVTHTQRGIRAMRHEGEAQAALLSAVNALAALADQPGDATRREAATRRVLHAASLAEERIGALGVAPFLEEPAQLLQFRLYGR